MDRICYALFGLIVGVVVAAIINPVEPQLPPEEEAAYDRYGHAVPALRVGDLAIMDDGVYVVVRSMGGRGESPLVRRVHPPEREEKAPKILHGGIYSSSRLALEDFRKTKELVRRGEPRWLEIQKQLQEAAAQK